MGEERTSVRTIYSFLRREKVEERTPHTQDLLPKHLQDGETQFLTRGWLQMKNSQLQHSKMQELLFNSGMSRTANNEIVSSGRQLLSPRARSATVVSPIPPESRLNFNLLPRDLEMNKDVLVPPPQILNVQPAVIHQEEHIPLPLPLPPPPPAEPEPEPEPLPVVPVQEPVKKIIKPSYTPVRMPINKHNGINSTGSDTRSYNVYSNQINDQNPVFSSISSAHIITPVRPPAPLRDDLRALPSNQNIVTAAPATTADDLLIQQISMAASKHWGSSYPVPKSVSSTTHY